MSKRSVGSRRPEFTDVERNTEVRGLGVCGCVLSVLEPAEALATVQTQVPDQRLAFARNQVAKMVGFMAAGPAAPADAAVLQDTGRECAKLGGLAARFNGDPEGYFATARKNWGPSLRGTRGRAASR